jgi:hypothetical protein
MRCVTGREKRLRASSPLPFSSQAASSSSSVTTMSSSAGNVRSASSIAFRGSESPTLDSTSSVGAASASSSARSAASVRASLSAFVSQSRREMSAAGATTSVSASSPACARTDSRRAVAGTEAVATTSRRRGTASAYPAPRLLRQGPSRPQRGTDRQARARLRRRRDQRANGGHRQRGLIGRHLTFVPLAGITIGPDRLQVPPLPAQLQPARQANAAADSPAANYPTAAPGSGSVRVSRAPAC